MASDVEYFFHVSMDPLYGSYKLCKHIYTPKIGVPKYIRKILEDFMKDIDSNTLIVVDFNTPLSTLDRSSKQRIKKDTLALNGSLNQMALTDIYRTCNPKEVQYTLFSNAYGTFSKIDT